MVKSKQKPVTQSDPKNHQSQWRDWRGDVSILAPNHENVALLPLGYPLKRSSLNRRAMHLIVQGPNCPEIVVAKFFNGGGQATLLNEDGAEVSRHMVLVMANFSSSIEEALITLSVPAYE